jgi:hypothetical protein
MDGLTKLCADNNLDPRQAPQVLALAARALAKRDPAAQSEMIRLLQNNGAKLPESSPPVDVDALMKAIEQAEDTYDFDELRQLASGLKPKPKPAEQETKPAETDKLELSTPKPDHNWDQVMQRAIDMEQTLKVTYGDDEGLAMATRIFNKAKNAIYRNYPDNTEEHEAKRAPLWMPMLIEARNNEIEALKAKPKPPRTVNSRRKVPTKPTDPLEAQEQELRKRLTGRK